MKPNRIWIKIYIVSFGWWWGMLRYPHQSSSYSGTEYREPLYKPDLVYVHAKSLPSCPPLCDPMD